MMDAATQQLHSAPPRYLATLAWCAAKLDYRPAPSVMQALCHASGATLASFDCQDLTMAVYAMAKMHWLPPVSWTLQLVDAAWARRDTFSARQLVLLLWSLSSLRGAFIGRGTSHNRCRRLAQLAYNKVGDMTPQGLTLLLFASTKLRLRPSKRSLEACLAACQARLGRFTAQDLARVAWALGNLKHRPELSWMDRYLEVVGDRLHLCSGAEVVTIAWGLVQLRCHVEESWVERLATVADSRMAELARWQKYTLTWAVKQLRRNACLPGSSRLVMYSRSFPSKHKDSVNAEMGVDDQVEGGQA
jgi:hypothetical protein